MYSYTHTGTGIHPCMKIHVGTHEYKYILLARPKEMPPADSVKWSCRRGQRARVTAVLGPCYSLGATSTHNFKSLHFANDQRELGKDFPQ